MNYNKEQLKEFEQEEALLKKYAEHFAIDPNRIQVSKKRLLEQIALAEKQRFSFKKIVATFSALLLILFSGIGTVSASYSSLPGDALFPVREYLESREIQRAETKEEQALIQLSHLEAKLEQMETKPNREKYTDYVDKKAKEAADNAGIEDEKFYTQLELFLNEEDYMNKKSLLSAMVGLALIVQPAMAQETLDDVDPGITPDSPLYVFDLLEEKIELLLTLDPEKDIEKRLEFALEKLAEARAMAESGDDSSADQAVDEYEEYVDEANEDAEEADEEGEEDLSSRVAEATYQHVLILEDLLNRVPEQARKGIENAIEKSQKGNHQAIESVSKRDQAKGAAMAAKQAEKRLERLKKLAEENGDVDPDEVEDELEDAEDEVELAESISDESDDEDSDEVDEVVKEVHRKHVEVLQEVYEKVPEQAQKGIERALENAERNEERFLEKLKEREERKEQKRQIREDDDLDEVEEEDEEEEEDDDQDDEEEDEEDEDDEEEDDE